MSLSKVIRWSMLIAGFYFLPSALYSQDNTMFYLQGVPQRYYTNPAVQPECNYFLGAPIVSSLHFKLENTGFSADQIYVNDTENDEVYKFYLRPESLNKLISKMDDVNYLSEELAFNLASFGFRTNKMYFTLDWTMKAYEKISYPKEILRFLTDTSTFTSGKFYDMSSLNIDFTSYSEIAIGISREFNEQLTIGIRPKILFGTGTMSTSNSDFQIDARERVWNVTAKTDINICTPGYIIQTDENGIIDLEQDIVFDSTITDKKDYRRLALSNTGFGIDAGVNYKPIQRLELSLSVIDLGFIKWKNYTNSVSLDGDFNFQGIEEYSADSLDFFEYLQDTLKSSFRVSGSNQSFTTYLNSKVYLGGRYFITQSFDVGAMSRIEFFKKNISTNIHILANWRPSSVFAISASYGLLDGSYTTFGLGFSSHIGPFNLYIVSDDIPTSYNVLKDRNSSTPIPRNMYSYSLRFGLNLVFGCNKIKKLMQDKPMYYSVEY